MPDLSNALVRTATQIQCVRGRVVQGSSGVTVSLGSLTGNTLDDQTQCSLTRNGAGDYTLTIYNFGSIDGASSCVALATVSTTGSGPTVQCPAASFSGSTATVPFLTFNSSASAADCSFNFEVQSYIFG